jgi:hypothetical protein
VGDEITTTENERAKRGDALDIVATVMGTFIVFLHLQPPETESRER